MSTTRVARIARVITGHDTATMLEALDDEGLEIKLEVPPAQARTIVAGQVLVLQWSTHTIPEWTSSSTFAVGTRVELGDPVDLEFDIRSEPPASTATPASARSILDEFNTLLGMPRRKG